MIASLFYLVQYNRQKTHIFPRKIYALFALNYT
nr:MAG TPA: hypothetical protein [Caudoviricetes sp.]